ncbi:uncharacterized protein L3040_007782 [Drepanopeziza brunnea f. sp. 'multigermtubi']|uniref:Extracellular metalloproteinase n=1 Tax=Marssonina brunnea f. sp. multigermtubi (strain MB_m1) TaxID=1072389 RepID=K1X673_MARBU|nr:neutral protease I [Drepanopeziza brunnea f. sp. 'multigermtubi' MB_m1]EKD16128.1 neutral protease I [Drepanopeziza brunnea f. sp. 'multigermtubi' MB_m1]KAJ5035307.1 hypothetical protein L3040_007782 [Drepanopeziza brunnea f. sp. 'multigermtubi']
MHFLFRTGAVALLAINAIGHPTSSHQSRGNIQARKIDLEAFRLTTASTYTNASTAADIEPSAGLVRPAGYVNTATALVRSVAPSAEFRLVEDHYVGSNGIAHVHFKQTVHGLDIDNADFNVNVGKDGRVFSFGDSFYDGELPAVSPIVKRDQVEPTAALKGAAAVLDLPIKASEAVAIPHPEQTLQYYLIQGAEGTVSEPKAKLVYFQDADNNLTLSWRVETDITNDWLLTYVNAVNAQHILGVVDYVTDSRWNVYPWMDVADPDKGSRGIETDPQNAEASECGFLGTGTTTYTVTRGNNGIAQANFEGDQSYINDFRPDGGASGIFDFPYSPAPTDAESYAAASAAQLFYTSNMMHDLYYVLGCTEAAGNFEVNNDGQGDLGNDPSGGMGEGWGDFYAIAISLKARETRAADRAMGDWINSDPAGIRTYRYSTRLATNPRTYASVNTQSRVHTIGTTWAAILYAVLWNLIDEHGITASRTPTVDADGAPTDGRYLAMKLVMDGMALQPGSPTFITARNAIIDADLALTGGANRCLLWKAFARRGLGSAAAAAAAAQGTGANRRIEDYSLPSGC